MGPKISEAKTPPLWKPVSLLSPLFLPPQFYLSFLNTSLSISNTQNQCIFFCFNITCAPAPSLFQPYAFLCRFSKVLVQILNVLMVAECVCGPHVRHSLPALLCNCSFFLSFCRIFLPPLITPSYLLPALRLPPCICLAYSSFHLPPGPLHNCHTYEHRARTSEHTTLHVQPENAQTGAHGQ